MTKLNGQVFLSEVNYTNKKSEALFILFRREGDFYNYVEKFMKKNPTCDNVRFYKNPNMMENGGIKTPNGILFPNEII